MTKKGHGILIIIFSLINFCSGCKKDNRAPTEVEKLPPITQNGAHTFGCLLNGVSYVPGGTGLGVNLSVFYDPTFQGGSLSIRAKKVITNGHTISITLNGDSINTTGIYPLSLHSKFNVVFSDQRNCRFDTYYDNPTSGLLNISKFDKTAGIISGTFSFKISAPTCQAMEATDGRFDLTL